MSTAFHGPQEHPAQRCSQTFRRIIGSPNNKAAWLEFLHFGPVILAKPKRGGSKRNLSNIINSRTTAWDKDTVPTVHCQTTDSKVSRKSYDSSRPAAAVSDKLEAGNFRAAVRIVCSGDTPAPVGLNQDTLDAVRAKHPGPSDDRRPLYDARDNPCFEALQVSKEDVMKVLVVHIPPLGWVPQVDRMISPYNISGTSWLDPQMTVYSKHL